MGTVPAPRFEIERQGVSGGHCDCCGHETRCVWGLVHVEGGATVAAYWVRWTVGRLAEDGAALDLVLGQWGEGATDDDRCAVSLLHRQEPNGRSSLMVVDAAPSENLATTGLKRSEVIGTPMAPGLFALVDAIYEQDGRFFC